MNGGGGNDRIVDLRDHNQIRRGAGNDAVVTNAQSRGRRTANG